MDHTLATKVDDGKQPELVPDVRKSVNISFFRLRDQDAAQMKSLEGWAALSKSLKRACAGSNTVVIEIELEVGEVGASLDQDSDIIVADVPISDVDGQLPKTVKGGQRLQGVC